VVVGFVYLLLNQVIGKLSEEQQKVLETVYRNSEELLELIDNVLWMTSLHAGDATATIEKFDGREVVREAVKRYERILDEKGLALSIEVADTGMSIISDRSKVERIFQNVLNNAIKFTSQGEIRIKAHPRPTIRALNSGYRHRDRYRKTRWTDLRAFQQVDTSSHRSFRDWA
jgi:signal transduction histidine kinase